MAGSDVEIPRAAYGLAFPLAVVAGYVDAVGFLTLAGLFVAHMSGNTVRLGVFVGDGDWGLAAQRLVPIIVFTIGVAAGIALVEALRRRSAPAPAARVLGVEAVLLLGFMLVGRIVLDGHGAAGARSAAATRRSSSPRASTTSSQPSAARARASASPSPREAPVISARFGIVRAPFLLVSEVDGTDGLPSPHRAEDGTSLGRKT